MLKTMKNKILACMAKLVLDVGIWGIPKFLITFFIFLLLNILIACMMTIHMHHAIYWVLFAIKEVFFYWIIYTFVQKYLNKKEK